MSVSEVRDGTERNAFHLTLDVDEHSIIHTPNISRVRQPEINASKYQDALHYDEDVFIYPCIENGQFHIEDDSAKKRFRLHVNKDNHEDGGIPFRALPFTACFSIDDPRKVATIYFKTTLDRTYQLRLLPQSLTIHEYSYPPGKEFHLTFGGRRVTELYSTLEERAVKEPTTVTVEEPVSASMLGSITGAAAYCSIQ